MFTPAHQQLSIYLLIDTLGELCCACFVKRNNDRATQRATEEHSHPLRRVRPPQQNALTFADPALFQLAGKTESSLGYLAIAPAFGAVPAPLHVGALPPPAEKVFKVFDNGAVLHA